jgi:hypothetical protein
MIDELTATAKQVGIELIDMSDMVAQNMQTWGDVLAQNPESTTATISAGFINKPSATSGPDMVIDVQAPPDGNAVLRTWAIQSKIDDDQKEYFNNIQLTFETDSQQVRDLITKGGSITRKDIRILLEDQASRLAKITVSNKSGGDGAKQTYGERYDFTVAELSQHPDDAAKINQALQTVLQTLKQSLANK